LEKSITQRLLAWLLEAIIPAFVILPARSVDLSLMIKAENCTQVRAQGGPIAVVLSNMEKDGYWVKAGPDTTQNIVQPSGPYPAGTTRRVRK